MSRTPEDQPTTVAPPTTSVPPTTAAPAPGAPPRAAVPPRAPVVREPVAAPAVVDPVWVARIEDRLGSLTSAVVVLAIVSLAALGLSIYALVQDDERDGASPARVSSLSERVSRLEGQSADAADTDTTRSLADQLGDKADSADVRRLRSDVDALRSDLQSSASGSDSAAQSVSALDSRLEQLEQQVADLSASAGGGTP